MVIEAGNISKGLGKLIFDPVNGVLRRSDGSFLKDVNCPKLKSWHSLAPLERGRRHCDSCERTVLNTARMTSNEVDREVQRDSGVCFLVHLDQENIEIKVDGKNG